MSQAHEHPPHLQHHFETPAQQFDAGKLGIWLFLATEILLFGGLFVAYSIYRANHPEIFIYAHQYLDKVLGGTNTVILLSSSLTMAWAVRAAQLGQRRLLVLLLSLTILGGFGFMGIKYVEYKAKWEHGLLPGSHFKPHEEEAAEAKAPPAPAPAPPVAGVELPGKNGPLLVEKSRIAPSAAGPGGTVHVQEPEAAAAERVHLGKRPSNVQVFFSIYFLMTGLHGIHVLVGIGLISWILIRSIRGEFGPEYFTPVDFVGLYWHLVDVIWIFLFPLLYLIGSR
ncbi:MAG TPA: cytochrome c oxidase subunit 3 [Candidatus Polarisedimenticolaceae bacterium]|nr:cytochrome c oxidase subunit 3 [Candidatus Polarisedimenticolaceae bacterium]